MAEDLLAHRALILELLVGETLDMAVDIAAVLHVVVTLHGRQVFTRIVFVRATINRAEVAVGLFVVAVRNHGAWFLERTELTGVVATATIPDVGLLRGVMQLFKRGQYNAFAICTMPVADRFRTSGAGHDLVVAVVVVQLFPPPRAGLRAIDLRHGVVIVACIHERRRAKLTQIRLAGGCAGLFTGLRQCRQQHGGQNGNDRNNDQKFNQRKNFFLLANCFYCLLLSFTNNSFISTNMN